MNKNILTFPNSQTRIIHEDITKRIILEHNKKETN